jgi:hypothetical protein
MYRICILCVLILGSALFSSCEYFKPAQTPYAIARVNNVYLNEKDIENLVPSEVSKEDSLAIVEGYIEKWASQQLLIQSAEVNLSDEQKKVLDDLIKQYRNDLYSKAYMEEIVKSQIDTLITEQDLKNYYLSNKENFRTTGVLVKLSYLNLPENHPKLSVIRQKFNSPRKKEDAKFWDQYQLQFKSFAMNDSVWVEMNQIYRKLPFITPDNRNEFIVKGKISEKKDSLNIYFVKIKDVLDKNQIAPYEYIKPTIKQVLLNRRKLEFIQKFEKEMVLDAKNNNKYEKYE